MNKLEAYSLYITAGSTILLIAIATISATYRNALLLAGSVGALGGLIHEVAQSHGKIVFFQVFEDGLYLGSVAGMVLGAVAGVLVARGYLIQAASGGLLETSMLQVSYDAFLAGLALKGVVEAAAGTKVHSLKQDQ